jgi:hypothetical protein
MMKLNITFQIQVVANIYPIEAVRHILEGKFGLQC